MSDHVAIDVGLGHGRKHSPVQRGAYESGWTTKIINKLKSLKQKSWDYTWIHRENSAYLNDVNDLLTVGGACLSLLNAIILVFRSNLVYIQVLTMILSFGAGLIQILNKLKNYPEMIQKHKMASSRFSTIFNKIEQQLSLPIPMRQNPLHFHQWISSQFDTLFGTAPDIDGYVIDKYRENIAKLKKTGKGRLGYAIEADDFNLFNNESSSSTSKKEKEKEKDDDYDSYSGEYYYSSNTSSYNLAANLFGDDESSDSTRKEDKDENNGGGDDGEAGGGGEAGGEAGGGGGEAGGGGETGGGGEGDGKGDEKEEEKPESEEKGKEESNLHFRPSSSKKLSMMVDKYAGSDSDENPRQSLRVSQGLGEEEETGGLQKEKEKEDEKEKKDYLRPISPSRRRKSRRSRGGGRGGKNTNFLRYEMNRFDNNMNFNDDFYNLNNLNPKTIMDDVVNLPL